MAAFRVVDPFLAFTNQQGQPLSLGSLTFYDTGGSVTPRNVYADKALLTSNGSTVALDSSGRANVETWGSGVYRVVLKDALGATIRIRDDVEVPGGSTGNTLPTPFVPGNFVTNDGAVASWAAIRQVIDPTGNAGKILGTDGTALVWQAPPSNGTTPTLPTLPVTGVIDTTTTIRVGKMLIQTGSSSTTATGGHTASIAVVFPTAYSSIPVYVGIAASINGITPSGYSAVMAATNQTTTGFTATVDVNSSDTNTNISVPITFKWIAMGVIP